MTACLEPDGDRERVCSWAEVLEVAQAERNALHELFQDCLRQFERCQLELLAPLGSAARAAPQSDDLPAPLLRVGNRLLGERPALQPGAAQNELYESDATGNQGAVLSPNSKALDDLLNARPSVLADHPDLSSPKLETQAMTTGGTEVSSMKRAGTDVLDMKSLQGTKKLAYRDCPSRIFRDFARRFEPRSIAYKVVLALSEWIDWVTLLEVPEGERYIDSFVRSKFFNNSCCLVIFLNAIFVTISTNEEAKNLSRVQPFYILVGELCFVGIYSIELLLKLIAFGRYFFLMADWKWNVFDLALVVFSWVETAVLHLTMNVKGTNLNLTPLRVLRILKIFKIIRLLRALRFLEDLRLMMDCLLGSMLALFWSFIMVLFFIFLFSVFFVQSMTEYMIDNSESLDEPDGLDIEFHFGSVESGVLCLFQSTTGGVDWSLIFNLIYMAGTLKAMVFVFYVAFFVIAIWNIVTSKFIERALRIAQPEVDSIMLESRRKELRDTMALSKMLRKIDIDDSGAISRKEFLEFFEIPQFEAFLQTRGIDIRDADSFFTMLQQANDDQEEVDIEVLVGSILRIKGVATAIDMLTLRYELKIIARSHQQRFTGIEERLDNLACPERMSVGSVVGSLTDNVNLMQI